MTIDEGVSIRPLGPGDVAAAKQVMLEVAATIFEPDHPAANFVNRHSAAFSDVDDHRTQYAPPSGAFLVAVDGGRIIGTAAIRRIDDETAELRRMWLLPEYHGRGIGYRLATELLAFARAAGYLRVRLSTDALQRRAIRFYRQLGFYPIDRYRDTDDDVFLELALAPQERLATDVVIRPIERQEADAAARLILAVAARLFQPHATEQFIADHAQELEDVRSFERQYAPPDGLFLVAKDGDAIIGTGALRRLDADTAELRRMWLLEPYQGRRIGLRLWQELRAFALAAGYRRVRLTSSVESARANLFYARQGFYSIGRYNHSTDGIFMETRLMPHTAFNPPELFDSQRYGFSQVIVAEGRRTVYCSGQVSWDATEEIGAPGDLAEQTRRALLNVERAVSAAGGTLDHVVSLRIYIVGDHIRNTTAVRQALLDTFGHEGQPAATWIGVYALANPDFIIEIEAIAVL